MKVRGIRIGTRFVLEDRGGVWVKTDETRARCVFGNREVYGSEIDVDPEAFAFGMFGRWAPMPEREEGRDEFPVEEPEQSRVSGPPAVESMGSPAAGMRITVVDCDSGNAMAEYKDVGSAEIAAVASVDLIGLTPGGRRKKRGYVVMDSSFDMEERRLFVSVREDKPLGARELDDDPFQASTTVGPEV